MDFITSAAADDYLHLSIVSWRLRLIGMTIFRERLNSLRSLAAHVDPASAYAGRLLPNDNTDERTELAPGDPAENARIAAESATATGFKKIDKINFVTHKGGLKDWHFHIGDSDPYPAVPHGHWHNKDQPKMDPYLGWVYKGATQQRRIERQSIIELWNDDRFREFAAIAIEHHINTYPHVGWRVSDPLRLPRRRKIK